MWNKKKISVVFPAYNEEGNIRKAINDFFSTGVVDEIIVVDNNSKDNTAKEAKKTKAKLVTEKKQGYGWAIRRGLSEATGDLIILAEPEGTFVAKDIKRLLIYSDDFEVVFGTRTNKACIKPGAYMGWFMRVGNWAVGKLMEWVHNGPTLSDVGCTMRLIHKDALNKIKNQFTKGDPLFSPEFMIICIRNKLNCVEVPLTYQGRIGESKITGGFWKAFKLGLKMIWLIFAYKLGLIKSKVLK